jgi:hypothetical protein
MNGETIKKQTWKTPEIIDLDVTKETGGKVDTSSEGGGYGKVS